MIVETETTVTASTAIVPLHNPNTDPGRATTLLLRNTSANAATVTVKGVVAGNGPLGGTKDYALAGSASLTINGLTYGETVTAIRSGGADATISVLRIYGR
jgi:hypothetical protein